MRDVRGMGGRGSSVGCHPLTEPPPPITAALREIRWGAQTLATAVGVNESTVRRWMRGQYNPPARVLAWLQRLAALHRSEPPPGG